MSSRTMFAASRTIWIGVVTLLCASLYAQQPAGSNSTSPPKKQLDTEVKHIGTAEATTVVKTGFYPDRQPKVYWHDQDWNIDLLIPASGEDPYSLSISSRGGVASIVKLPDLYSQINTISRAPGDKAIIEVDCGGTCSGFLIVDLRQGKVIDDIGCEFTNISPNHSFILYENWFPAHAESHVNQYHLNDVTKSPRENVSSNRDNDPQHKDLDGNMRGFQVYPQKPGQVICNDVEDDDNPDDNLATNFTWAADSSKIVFADVKSGVMSLILVTMPGGAKDLPRTSTYALIGQEDACEGVTDAAGERHCDYHTIKFLGLDGDNVKAAFLLHENGKPVEKDMTIPLSKFVPIGK